MRKFWQRKRYALVAWEVRVMDQIVFLGNTSIDYMPPDRSALHDVLKEGAAGYASSAMGRMIEPKQVHITGFFPVP